MNIYEAIIALYPDLKSDDFDFGGTISLRNDSDGRGDYIFEWSHPTYEQPTEEQLIAAGWVK